MMVACFGCITDLALRSDLTGEKWLNGVLVYFQVMDIDKVGEGVRLQKALAGI